MPTYTDDVIISKAAAALKLDETGSTPHTWEFVAAGATCQLQDVTNSVIRIIVDANGRVGIGAAVTDLSPNRLTLKHSSTCLGFINGTPDARITGAVNMIGGIQNVAPPSGTKWRGLSMHPSFVAGAGQIDLIGIACNFGSAPVLFITRAGSTATVTTGYVANGVTYSFDHGYATGDSVVISGAVQTEYNGTFTITVPPGSTNTFTYTVSGTPASPATGTIYQKLASWNSTNAEAGMFIGGILSGGSGSSYGAHFGVVTASDPSGTAKERGLLITIDRRPGCPVANTSDSFSRGIEISSAGSLPDYSDNLRAGSGIEIYGKWTNGIFVSPDAYYNGFGTTQPNARLHVAGPGDEAIKLETTGGAGSAWSLAVISSDGSLRLSSGSTEVARFAKTSGAFRTGYGADSTSYTQSNANLLAGDNVEALGVVGTTNNVNINLYSKGAAARKATIQAVISGTQGAQLRFYVKPDSVLDVQQAGYFEWDGGFVLGSATGGSRGAGTLNVAADVYKNGTAYTNPDYVFEHWLSGKSNSPYAGLMPLGSLRDHLVATRRLPGIRDEPMGMFARGDVLLEKIEEAYLYIIELHEKVERIARNSVNLL